MIRHALVIPVIFIGAHALASGDIEAGRLKSEACRSCHNASYDEHPNLKGQQQLFLEKALRHFRSKFWFSPTMSPVAASLSDQDIRDLSAYFSNQ
ncbi:cytochrome c [Pseudomaricurvus alkylphenolicus]|uniref:c-type cytochrome n=1 Tax=Pseudomaricurvus alkylphenolicus TaxID=1306991 RepID=UPI00141DD72A|nr:cytochrome c [Pseudomaricurvus alkylphenolicus]NIB40835.1 cytochrome c [Pseudomaricurvus alkylphenolicus]